MNDPLGLFTDDDPLGLFDGEAPKPSVGDMAVGGAETLGSMITGGLGTIAGGLAAIPALPFGADTANDVLSSVTDSLTYQPRSSTGKEYTNTIGEGLEKFISGASWMMEPTVKTLLPTADDNQVQMVSRVLTETGSNFVPVEGALRGLNHFRKPLNTESAAKLQSAPEVPAVDRGVETLAHADDFSTINPYDIGGHVSEFNAGRTSTVDVPQRDLFNSSEDGAVPSPRIEEVLPESLLNDQHKGNLVEFDGPGLQEHTPSDGGVRHLDPTTGKVVQGMDASVPTVDILLKTEAAAGDPVIQRMREQVAAQQAQIDHMRERGVPEEQIAKVQESLNKMSAKFGEYMDKGYGIKSASELLNSKVIGTGKGTKLPIKQTHNAGKPKFGFKNKQGGSIKVKEIQDGFKSLSERLAKLNESSRIMREASTPIPETRKGLTQFTEKKSPPPIEQQITLKNGDSVTLKVEKGDVWGIVTAVDGSGKEIGKLDYSTQGWNPTVEVDPTMRRKGVATALYDFAEAHGAKIPDDAAGSVRTPDGSAFRNARLDRQRGAINAGELREGLNILKNKFMGKGVPKGLAEAAAKGTTKPAPQPTVTNPTIQALKQSAAGKGLAEFSALNKTPDEVVAMVKEMGPDADIKRKWVQENVENGGLFRSLDTRNPVVMYTVERFTKGTQIAGRMIREHLTDPNTGLKGKFRAMTKKAKAELWGAMMLAEGQADLTPTQLYDRGFTKTQVDAYSKYKELNDKFFEEFNAVRKNLGLKEIDRRLGHVVGRFMGDFRVMAKRPKLDKEGNPLFDENGQMQTELIGFVGGNTKWEVNRAVKFMKEKHPDWDFGKVEYRKIGKGHSAADRFAGLMEVVNMVSKENPHMKEIVDSYRELLKSDAQHYLDTANRAKGKKAQAGGLKGSEGNKPWETLEKNADQGMKSILTYFENGFQWVEMQKASKDVAAVTGDQAVIDRMPNAVDWSAKYRDQVTGRDQGWVADATNGLMNMVGETFGIGHTPFMKGSNRVKHLFMQKFMGFGNIPFTLTQLVQPLQTLPPAVALMKVRGVDFSAIRAGMDATGTMMKWSLDNTLPRDGNTKYTELETAALNYAHDNAVFEVQIVDHTKDINSSKLADAYDFVADANLRYPEMMTRGTAYMFYVHALKDVPGMSRKDIFQMAENMTKMTMTDYTPNARPGVYGKMGFAGDLASTLARFKHNQISQITYYGREAKEGLKRGELQYSAPLMTYLGTSIAAGGIVGLMGYNTADYLYRELSSLFGKPDSLTDMVMRNGDIPEAVSHGVSSLAGIDMSSRFSQAQLVPESPIEFLIPFAGGMSDVYEATSAVVKQPNEFNAKWAAKAWAPSSVQGLLENQLFGEKQPDGSTLIRNPRRAEGSVKRDDEQVSLRNFGFRTTKEARTQDKLYQQKVLDQMYVEKRTKLVDKAIREYLSGNFDRGTAMEFAQKYYEYNGDPNNFVRDFNNAVNAANLTAEERWKMRNAGNNLTAAIRMQHWNNPGYNKGR